MTRPACPTCRDLGWVEEPYYGNFKPCTKPVPCHACNPTPQQVSDVGCLVGCIVMILGLALVAAVLP